MNLSSFFFLVGFILPTFELKLVEISSENNPLKSDQGKGYDYQCFYDHFRLNSENSSHSAEGDSYQAIVVTKRIKHDQYGKQVISTQEDKISRSSIYWIQFEGSDVISNNSLRNLTFSFDGDVVEFAMGKWVEKSTFGHQQAGWEGCQYATDNGSLVYFDYTEINSKAQLDWFANSYDVSFRSATPSGPDHDNTCVPAHSFGTKDRRINLRHMGAISDVLFPVEYSNQNYTVQSGKDLVVELEALNCKYDKDEKGCDWVTRYLTLWVDEDNQVRMAMALLYEDFTVTNYEQWECALVYYNEDGSMDLTFVTYERSSYSITNIFVSVRQLPC